MTTMADIEPFLGQINSLTTLAQGSKNEYTLPTLKNLGSVTIPLIREVISPTSFRNEQSEITDIDVGGIRRVRAGANKFKYGERQRGLQVLRYFGAGGTCPQNRTEIPKGQTAGAVFDLNTIVFGDSTKTGGKILPVKAGALYSDALSISPYAECVDKTFHNRAAEDGTLFDAENKKNSGAIFERHFIKPGTLLVQTVTFNGRTAPVEAIEHFLLCVGLAGAYGGQTSINGINVRTHIAGIHAAPLEREISSPYVIIEELRKGKTPSDTFAVRTFIEQMFITQFPVSVSSERASSLLSSLIKKLEINDSELRTRYKDGQKKIATFFNAWFGGIKGS